MNTFKTGAVRALTALLGTALLAGTLFAVNGYVNTKTATSLLGQKNYSDTSPYAVGPGVWHPLRPLSDLEGLEEVSFLLDPINGLPRAAYTMNGNLYYTEYFFRDNANEGWTAPQLIDANLYPDEEIFMAFDGDGDTHIGYQKLDTYAYHAFWSGGAWSTEQVAVAQGCSSPVLSAHPGGTTVFLAFYANSDTFWVDDFSNPLEKNNMGGADTHFAFGGVLGPNRIADSGPGGPGDTALHLYFSMISPGYFGGFAFPLTSNREIDLVNLTHLKFDIRRDLLNVAADFRIIIEDSQGETLAATLTSLGETTTNNWHTLSVPLSSLTGSGDRSRARRLIFFFSYELCSTTGGFLFDNIRFENKIQPHHPPFNLHMIARESAWPAALPSVPMASAVKSWGGLAVATLPNGGNDLIYQDYAKGCLRYVRGAGNDFPIEDGVADFAALSTSNFSTSLLYYDTNTHEICYGNLYLGTDSLLNQDTVVLDVNHSNAGRGAALSFGFTPDGETCVGYFFEGAGGGTVAVWMNRGAGYNWYTENPDFLQGEEDGFEIYVHSGADTVILAYPDLNFVFSLDGKDTGAVGMCVKKGFNNIGSSSTSPAVPSAPFWPHQKELFMNPFGLSAHGGYLYAADASWNRILVFPLSASGATSSQAAALFGQPNHYSTAPGSGGGLNSPSGLAHDVFGNLWVADRGNNRVLRFNAAAGGGPGDTIPDFVIGQADFEETSPGASDTKLAAPYGVAFDPFGNLWVSDNGNHRVLRFNAGAGGLVSDAAADFVIGQSDFTAGDSGLSASKLRHPEGIALDPVGNLWVCDERNNRVLFFASAHDTTIPVGEVPSPALITDAAADGIWGQSRYDTNTPGLSIDRSASPISVAISSCGYVYLSEGGDLNGNNRVLRFDPTMLCGYTNTFEPDFVIGQEDFTTNDSGTSNTMFRGPEGVCVDEWGNLWVSDAGNRRVIMFLDPPDRAILNTSFGHCFVASALWGAGSGEAAVLRAFRDRHLLTNRAGRLFVRAYMAASPALTRQWNGCSSCSSFWRSALTPLVGLASFSVEYGLGAFLALLGIPVLLAGLSPLFTRRA